MHPTHPRKRPWPTVLLLVLSAVLLALAALVLIAPPAGAHALGGVEPSNYRTRVLAVRPAVAGLSVGVVDAGTRLRLVNTGTRDVVVLGYQSEPWLRVGPRGVFENTRSPTLRMAGPRRADSPPPAAADPAAPASWRQVGTGQSVAWHDHRAHWEAAEPPAQVRRAPGSAHVVVPEWTVKLRTGKRLVDVVGEVRWVPGPSPLPWLAGAALLAMAVVAASRTRRWTGAVVTALGLVVAVDLVQVAGTWAGVAAPPASKLLSIGASAAGWVVAGTAIRQLLRRRLESGLFQLLLAAGLLTIVGGLGDLGFLLRSQLASALPGWTVRAAVTAKIGLGLGALVAAGLRLQHTLADRDPAVDDRENPMRPSATLPLRGPQQPGVGYPGAHRGTQQPGVGHPSAHRGTQRWADDLPDAGWAGSDDLDDPDGLDPPAPELPEPTPVPQLHVVGGRTRRPTRDRAAATSTSATVLPWPGTRHSGNFDPDLPGGA